MGAQTRGTQNECCVSMLRKLGNICCGHKMFLSRTQNLYPQQKLRAWANGETFVSASMCPQQCVLVCQGLKRRLTTPSIPHPCQKKRHDREKAFIGQQIGRFLWRCGCAFFYSPSIIDIEDKCQRLIKHAFSCRECYVPAKLAEQNCSRETRLR